ncbi:MAG: hypothetical protein CO035_05525, partial [Candidatus Omnitrophica bacterium CG_4_9_14_0_2_um_filter_42_8]
NYNPGDKNWTKKKEKDAFIYEHTSDGEVDKKIVINNTGDILFYRNGTIEETLRDATPEEIGRFADCAKVSETRDTSKNNEVIGYILYNANQIPLSGLMTKKQYDMGAIIKVPLSQFGASLAKLDKTGLAQGLINDSSLVLDAIMSREDSGMRNEEIYVYVEDLNGNAAIVVNRLNDSNIMTVERKDGESIITGKVKLDKPKEVSSPITGESIGFIRYEHIKSIEFVRDENGKANGVILETHLNKITYVAGEDGKPGQSILMPAAKQEEKISLKEENIVSSPMVYTRGNQNKSFEYVDMQMEADKSLEEYANKSDSFNDFENNWATVDKAKSIQEVYKEYFDTEEDKLDINNPPAGSKVEKVD